MASKEALERSVRLLDDALNMSATSLVYPDVSRPVTSKRISMIDNDSIFDTTRMSKISKIRQSDINNLSITLSPDDISKLWDMTETKVAQYPSTTSLYHSFQEAFISNCSTQRVFDGVSEFIEYCSITLDGCVSTKGVVDSEGNDMTWLINERNTWRLVYGLYRDRIFNQDEDETSMQMDEYSHHMSEKECAMNLYRIESSVRECQLIIDWLERISGDYYKVMRVGHFTDQTVAWENTLHQMQNKVVPYMSSRDTVMSLDPDAPLRERRPLHDLDIEDEERLLEQMFFEIRCGRLDKAKELCVHCGQAWRAATLEGWRLHHDPNYSKKIPEGEKLPVEGNPNRDVWKISAWRLCEDTRAHPKARACMAVYCGHLGALMPICTNWEDLLWAYTRSMVDRKVEREIRDNSPREQVPMPPKYWDLLLSLEDIFRELKANDLSSTEAAKPDRVIQELLALDRVPDLLSRMSEWVRSDCTPQFLRFLAHLVIVLRVMGRSEPEHLGDIVIKAYVKVLMNKGECDLVAYYTSLLPSDEQIELYCSFMESITEDAKRVECLKAAETYELNIKFIVEKVVENIRSKNNDVDNEEYELCKDTTEADLVKISALDWVTYYKHQRVEAMTQANALIRTFIGQSKVDAARKAFFKMPLNSVETVLLQYNCQSGDNHEELTRKLPPKVNSVIKEYLCFKIYLDAVEGFSDWFKNYHNSKPVIPILPQGSATDFTFPDRVVFDHKMKIYNEELERWKLKISHHTKIVKQQLYNVILFPDQGWLVDTSDEDEARQNQLAALRTLCIPEVVFLLHTVLDDVEDFEECLDLSSLVMDENKGIYKLFTKVQLGDLLVKIAESAQSILRTSNDPFGDCGPEDEDDDDSQME